MADVKEVVEYAINAPREAILAWKNDGVTKAILALVQEEINDYQRRAGHGETLTDHAVRDTARLVGRVEGLSFLLDVLDAQFISGEDDDGEKAS